jgi:hypothetical protein
MVALDVDFRHPGRFTYTITQSQSQSFPSSVAPALDCVCPVAPCSVVVDEAKLLPVVGVFGRAGVAPTLAFNSFTCLSSSLILCLSI